MLNLENEYEIKFSIRYQTNPGQNILIYGNLPQLGNWKQPIFMLKWNEGHIWKGSLNLPYNIKYFEYKFVCETSDHSYKRWEQGLNRIFFFDKITEPGNKIRLECVWEHFNIRFNIFYPLKNDIDYMRIIGDPKELGSWFQNDGKAIKMTLSKTKTLGTITGRFWETNVLFSSTELKSYNFEYRYNIFSPLKNSALWEREPNRKIKIISDISKIENDDYVNRYEEVLVNNIIERLDINFVGDLKFDKIGDYPIYIGPYPQNEQEIEQLAKSGITSVLNVQSDLDLIHREINWKDMLNAYKHNNIRIERYPIFDFNQEDLISKIKGAGEILNDLIIDNEMVYVHCTAGMSRAAATVIIYLVLYETFSLEEAYEYVKSFREVICPNMRALALVVNEFK